MRTPRRRAAIKTSIGLVSVLLLCACRSGTNPVPVVVPVPEAVHRLHYDIPLGLDESATVLAEALEATVCLLRGGIPSECQGSGSSSICNTRDVTEIQAAVEPFFQNVLDLALTSSSRVNQEFRSTITGAEPTRNVADARRSASCLEWRNENGACVAAKIDRAWFYLHAMPSEHGGRPDWFEVFLVEPVCSKESPNSRGGN